MANRRGVATCPSCKATVWIPKDQYDTSYCNCGAMRAYVESTREGNLQVVVTAKLIDGRGMTFEDEVSRFMYHGPYT